MLFQTSATSAGATSSCGKRASASLDNSPRAAARLSMARNAAVTRSITS